MEVTDDGVTVKENFNSGQIAREKLESDSGLRHLPYCKTLGLM